MQYDIKILNMQQNIDTNQHLHIHNDNLILYL